MIVKDCRSPRGRYVDTSDRSVFDAPVLMDEEYGRGRSWRDPDEVFARRTIERESRRGSIRAKFATRPAPTPEVAKAEARAIRVHREERWHRPVLTDEERRERDRARMQRLRERQRGGPARVPMTDEERRARNRSRMAVWRAAQRLHQ
jgi:hypothetical protein